MSIMVNFSLFYATNRMLRFFGFALRIFFLWESCLNTALKDKIKLKRSQVQELQKEARMSKEGAETPPMDSLSQAQKRHEQTEFT
jgi:hypothetical protein